LLFSLSDRLISAIPIVDPSWIHFIPKSKQFAWKAAGHKFNYKLHFRERNSFNPLLSYEQ
jgi:hypothetical protein